MRRKHKLQVLYMFNLCAMAQVCEGPEQLVHGQPPRKLDGSWMSVTGWHLEETFWTAMALTKVKPDYIIISEGKLPPHNVQHYFCDQEFFCDHLFRARRMIVIKPRSHFVCVVHGTQIEVLNKCSAQLVELEVLHRTSSASTCCSYIHPLI